MQHFNDMHPNEFHRGNNMPHTNGREIAKEGQLRLHITTQREIGALILQGVDNQTNGRSLFACNCAVDLISSATSGWNSVAEEIRGTLSPHHVVVMPPIKPQFV